MSKVIAVIDKPNNCQDCAFARCKYSLPFTTMKKGYYCELLPPDQRTIKNVDYNDDVHLKHCPLIPIPEKWKYAEPMATETFQPHIKSDGMPVLIRY